MMRCVALLLLAAAVACSAQQCSQVKDLIIGQDYIAQTSTKDVSSCCSACNDNKK